MPDGKLKPRKDEETVNLREFRELKKRVKMRLDQLSAVLDEGEATEE